MHSSPIRCRRAALCTLGLRLLVLPLAFALSGASCMGLRTCVLPDNAALPEVLSLLNSNAQFVNSLSADDIHITVQSDGLPFMLRAKMAMERPRRFRLVARTTVGGDEIDLGSNDELFWYWIARAEPPSLYYARHDAGTAQAIPFDPEWIFEAMGIGELQLGEVSEGPTPVGGGRVELRSLRATAHGEMVTKVTTLDACQGWIVEQSLVDARGRTLCRAVLSDHRKDPGTGAVLPRRVHLTWPEEGLSLKLRLGEIRVNEVPSSTNLWAKPSKPQEVDLSEGVLPAGTGVPRFP